MYWLQHVLVVIFGMNTLVVVARNFNCCLSQIELENLITIYVM